MFASSDGSLLRQQGSEVKDSLDEDFTPEELSLVQHLLPPERFVRVLLALRVKLKSCPESEDLQTPSKKLQPSFDSNSCTSQTSARSHLVQNTDQHVHITQSSSHAGMHLPTQVSPQMPDSSDDEEVPAPARQFATAAAEFWFRLQHDTHLQQINDTGLSKEGAEECLPGQHQASQHPVHRCSANSEEEPENVKHPFKHVQTPGLLRAGKSAGGIDATREAVTEAGKFHEEQDQNSPCAHRSPQQTQGVGSELAADTASSRQQQPRRGKLVQASTLPSQLGLVRESVLQRLADGKTLAGGNPARLGPDAKVSSHHRRQHSSAAMVESDSDTDDGDSMREDDRPGSKQPFASQQGKDPVRNFMARLHKPRSLSLQRQRLQQTCLQQDHTSMQLQQQQVPLRHRQGTPAQPAQTASAAALPRLTADATSRSRQRSANAEVPTVLSPHAHLLNTIHQPLHQMTQNVCSQDADVVSQDVCNDNAGVGLSPVQTAVSAVVGRLHSVQLGLASAEDRLALLTGRRPAIKRLDPAEDQSLFRGPVQCSEEDKGQQHDAIHRGGQGAVMPSGVSDIIRRFDSGKAWGSLQQGAHAKGAVSDSLEPAQQSPRIAAMVQQRQKEEEDIASQAESDLIVMGKGNKSLQASADPDQLTDSEGSLMQSQLEEEYQGQACLEKTIELQPQLTGQGSFVLPRLSGQGSSMRGDVWLPQLWLEPAEQLQHSASPRCRMHKAMEAVRAAERAVKAASAFAPSK